MNEESRERSRSDGIVLFAQYVNKLYPDLHILDEKNFLAEQCLRSPEPLLDRLIKCDAISKKTAAALGSIIDHKPLQRPAYFVETAKYYYSKFGKLTEDAKLKILNTLDEALEKQQALRKSGRSVPVIGKFLMRYGFSAHDMEIISTMQYADFLRRNPDAAIDVKIKLTGRFSKSYFRDKGLLVKGPIRNLISGILLGILIVTLCSVHWSKKQAVPISAADKLPGYYMSVIYAAQFRNRNREEYATEQIRLAHNCIDEVLQSPTSTEQEKAEAIEFQNKLKIIKKNLARVRNENADKLTTMSPAEVEKLLLAKT